MRLGYVRGTVVLSLAYGALDGKRLVIVEPITAHNLANQNGLGGGRTLVAVDKLNAAEGEMVGFIEGGEAANPFWPNQVPVDAYCALIVQALDYVADVSTALGV